MKRFLLLLLIPVLAACAPSKPTVLVFTKTAGHWHKSIPAATAAFEQMADERGFELILTEDSLQFSDAVLKEVDAVVFLLTTLDVLGDQGQIALQRFVQAGGGFVGVHSATDTEYAWPWYGQLVGGYFDGHPPGTYETAFTITDAEFSATDMLPDAWIRTDEMYDIRNIAPDVNVLITADETTYKSPDMNPSSAPHPMAWYHEFDGGRSFYTALGHTEASYSEPLFLDHLYGGLLYAIGDGTPLDYDRPGVRPNDADFDRQVLAENLNEPMELTVLPDGKALWVERHGDVFLADPATGDVSSAGQIAVFDGFEDGLLGIAADPNFDENNWVYVFYSSPEAEPEQRLVRFTLTAGMLDPASERILLRVPTQRVECCHSGGSVAFGPDGTLFVSTGDDTNPFASDGFAPTDERTGRAAWDAQRTSANSQDLRGKILRIQPQDDGTYTIPDGNLFPADGTRGRPEVYVMGNRNPFRINVDQRSGWLYWGEIGPDAGEADPERGPRGHDEINQARGPGFFGWPYFVGNNKPYADFDFAAGNTAGTAAEFAVEAAPLNDSPNNTGIQFLPPAQGALIWYPYGKSDEFPLLVAGGRSAMAGPVFYADQTAGFPGYFDGRLFMHEWMRNRIYTVVLNQYGWYERMETFLPSMTFSRPMDMAFSPDGSLWVLEYGQTWNARNQDARLIRLSFDG